MIHEAAVDGSRHARAIVGRLHQAFGIPFPHSMREVHFLWLYEAAQMRSHVARQDLESLFPERSHQLRDLPELPDGYWSQRLINICNEIVNRVHVHISSQDVSIGPDGDTMLHWCAFLPSALGVRAATVLLDHGCSPATVTFAECKLDPHLKSDPYCTVMPSRTTPIDWAIIEDNLAVLKVLLNSVQEPYGNTVESAAFTPATCAAYFQRTECLRCILESGHSASECDDRGYLPMFYACRPDLFTRILYFSCSSSSQFIPEGPVERCDSRAPSPVVQREINIIELLRAHDASLTACKGVDFNCLHLGAAAEDSLVLDAILKEGNLPQYINENARGEWTPLGYAISLGNAHAAMKLLSHGANIKQVSPDRGYNMLHICAIYTRPKSAKIASELAGRLRALVNLRSKSGYTALHFAAVSGNVALMRTLISKGAHMMAASNKVTPLGLAIAYWSEFGVEQMCTLHKEKKVPLIAAFNSYDTGRPWRSLPVCREYGPLTMMLAPGNFSAVSRVRELHGRSDQTGFYEPPLSGLAESILRIVLRFPASGSLLEYLKIWYYRLTQQYSCKEISRRSCQINTSRRFSLLIDFVIGSFFFLLFGVNEIYDAIKWTIKTDDSKLVEILFEECSRRNVSADIRRLISYCQCQYTDRMRILCLLLEQQKRIFSQKKRRRTQGPLRFFWRPFYRLYLDIEQSEYMRYNQYTVEHPISTYTDAGANYVYGMVVEFSPICPPLRLPAYIVLFAVLWAILGRMIYDLTSFGRSIGTPMPTSSIIWSVALLVVVSTTMNSRN